MHPTHGARLEEAHDHSNLHVRRRRHRRHFTTPKALAEHAQHAPNRCAHNHRPIRSPDGETRTDRNSRKISSNSSFFQIKIFPKKLSSFSRSSSGAPFAMSETSPRSPVDRVRLIYCFCSDLRLFPPVATWMAPRRTSGQCNGLTYDVAPFSIPGRVCTYR